MTWTPFSGVQKPKARKEHDCEWCVEVIPAGEQYVRWVGVDDGYMLTMKVHEDCYVTSDEAITFRRKHGCHEDEGWCMGPHQRAERCGECDDLPMKPQPFTT